MKTNDEEAQVRIVLRLASRVVSIIEENVGPFSQEQRNSVGSSVMSFWAVAQDKTFPRQDGETWREIVWRQAVKD